MKLGNPRRIPLALLAAAVATAVALGGAELVLVDGRVLRGDSVRRDGNLYVLATETGELTMPADLVAEVRLTGSPEPRPPALDGIPEGPTGMAVGPARTIAGPDVPPPRTEDQLRVMGKPSEFKKSIVDSDWVPTSDWNMDPETQNNWAPSTWAKAPIDPTWVPESAFDANEDVLAESRSTWKKAPIDSTWTPTDGFKKSAW